MENRIKTLIRRLVRFGYLIGPKRTGSADPVCGMAATSDLFQAEHQGQIYYFCSNHCMQQFIESPDAYTD